MGGWCLFFFFPFFYKVKYHNNNFINKNKKKKKLFFFFFFWEEEGFCCQVGSVVLIGNMLKCHPVGVNEFQTTSQKVVQRLKAQTATILFFSFSLSLYCICICGGNSLVGRHPPLRFGLFCLVSIIKLLIFKGIINGGNGKPNP